MNTLTDTKSKINPMSILGGIPGLFEEGDFEREKREIDVTSVVKEAGSLVFEDILGVGQETDRLAIGGKTELNFKENQAKFEKQEKDRKEAARKKTFYQALKDEQLSGQRAKDRMWFEEEMNDITANLPTEEKNRLLHYQASYKDRSIYQRAALRKKLIEEGRKAEKKSKEPAIPSPAKQASALDTQFEGGAGAVGGGQANLKFGIG